jgi:ABC-type dipeptide/oligopeptide/nickel transport system permease component
VSRFLVERLVKAIPTLLGITLVAFVVLRLAPGDPVDIMIAGSQNARPEDLAAMRAAYGLDQPRRRRLGGMC